MNAPRPAHAAHGTVFHAGYRTGKVFAVPLVETYCGHCQKWVKTSGGLGWVSFHITHDQGRCSSARDTIPDAAP